MATIFPVSKTEIELLLNIFISHKYLLKIHSIYTILLKDLVNLPVVYMNLMMSQS